MTADGCAVSVRIRQRPTALVLALTATLLLLAVLALAYHYRHSPEKAFSAAAVGLIAAVAVFALPDVRPSYPICCGFALSVFSGYWSQLGIPLGLDKPLILYGIAAVFVQALPDQRQCALPTMTPLRWLLVVVGLYALCSAAISGTLTDHDALFALIDQFGLIGFALFILAPSVFTTEHDRNVLLATFIGLGAYLGWVAFCEGTHISALVFPRYINNPALGIHYGRARGPFLEAVANGLSLYACAVAAAMGLSKWWKRPWIRLACMAVLVLCGLGIIFTLTREVWLGSAVATALVMLYQRRLRVYLLPAASLAAVAVLLALALVPGLHADATARAGDQQSVWDRLNSDSAGLRMLDARPLFGFGWYEFGPDSTPYYRQAETYPLTTVGRIHNVFLAIAVDLGLVGFLGWFIGLLGAIGGALRRRGPPDVELWRVGLLAVAADWLIVANFTPLGYAFPNHLIWLWSGLVVGAGCGLETRQPALSVSR